MNIKDYYMSKRPRLRGRIGHCITAKNVLSPFFYSNLLYKNGQTLCPKSLT